MESSIFVSVEPEVLEKTTKKNKEEEGVYGFVIFRVGSFLKRVSSDFIPLTAAIAKGLFSTLMNNLD